MELRDHRLLFARALWAVLLLCVAGVFAFGVHFKDRWFQPGTVLIAVAAALARRQWSWRIRVSLRAT
jgi:hypothetical protein